QCAIRPATGDGATALAIITGQMSNVLAAGRSRPLFRGGDASCHYAGAPQREALPRRATHALPHLLFDTEDIGLRLIRAWLGRLPPPRSYERISRHQTRSAASANACGKLRACRHWRQTRPRATPNRAVWNNLR